MKVTDDDISKYHRGELSAAERHALEKRALSDPFLADALEGAEEISPDDFSKDVTNLAGKIHRRKTLLTPLRIAAGVIVIIAAGWLSLSVLDQSSPEQLTSAEEKQQKNEAAKDSAAGEQNKAEEKEDQLLSLKREDAKEAPKIQRTPTPVTSTPELASRDGGAGAKPAVAEPVREEAELADAGPYTEQEAARDSVTAPLAQPSQTQGLALEQQKEESRSAKRTAATQKRQADFILSDDSKAKKDDQDAGNMITGKVTLAEDGLALPGVNIRLKGSSLGTVTDLNGNYTMAVPQANSTLVFSFIGLQTQEASPTSQTLDIKLAEDVSQLSEVVVTGTAIPADLSGEPVIKLAEPVGGLRAYDKYLEGNLRYPQQAIASNVKGRVYIQFTVAVDGTIGEFKVMKSLGHGCDEEVIRLVKEGPAWIPSTENNVPTESLVRVRMKFDPSKRK